MFCAVPKVERRFRAYSILQYFIIRISYFHIWLFCFYMPVAYSKCGSSQAISLSGDACIGGILKATTNTPASSIVRKLNGSKIVATQSPAVLTAAITVAGGNRDEVINARPLSYPHRYFVDAAGNVFIPDMGNNRIRNGSRRNNGCYSGWRKWWRRCLQTSSTASYKCLCQCTGNLYVTDQNNGSIQKWGPGATAGVTVAWVLFPAQRLFL